MLAFRSLMGLNLYPEFEIDLLFITLHVFKFSIF